VIEAQTRQLFKIQLIPSISELGGNRWNNPQSQRLQDNAFLSFGFDFETHKNVRRPFPPFQIINSKYQTSVELQPDGIESMKRLRQINSAK
jgi:hypothetical protein